MRGLAKTAAREFPAPVPTGRYSVQAVGKPLRADLCCLRALAGAAADIAIGPADGLIAASSAQFKDHFYRDAFLLLTW